MIFRWLRNNFDFSAPELSQELTDADTNDCSCVNCGGVLRYVARGGAAIRVRCDSCHKEFIESIFGSEEVTD